jgi:hypothetical protein
MTEVPKSPTNSNTQTGPGGPESTGGNGGKKGDTVVIAMDGSEYSEYALQCMYLFPSYTRVHYRRSFQK